MANTLALLEQANKGDKKARDTIFNENTGLVWSIVRRFSGRGVEMEDLFQIGSIGLLKAIDKFDLSYKVQFSTYAVPMITGEIKRFLRDDGMLKVSRSLKEIQGKAYAAKKRFERTKGREPSLKELAELTQIAAEELLLAMEAAADVESLQKNIYQGEASEVLLEEKIPEKKDAQEKMMDRIFLEEILNKLDGESRKFIYQRYVLERTQKEIAKEKGVSQVQISRMEKKLLQKIRELV